MRPEAKVRLLYFLGFFTIVVFLLVGVAILSSAGNTISNREGAALTAEKRYVTDEFRPTFSFVAVGEEWFSMGEFNGFLSIGRESAGETSELAFINVEEVINPNKPLDSTATKPAPEDMVGWLQNHPHLQIEKPELVSVGGIKGVYFDAVVVDPSRVWLFGLSQGEWYAAEGDKSRFIVLEDVRGETVTIIVEARAVDFEEFLPKAEKVLDSVEWGGS
jgi:hypothetical protein